MATYKGNDGSVTVGSSGAVTNVRSFSIEASAATAETTAMGSSVATHVATITSWTASCDVFWDPADSDGQVALSPGATVTVKFIPVDTGTPASDVFYSGSALVTGHSRSTSHDGLVEASISLQGTGALTTGPS